MPTTLAAFFDRYRRAFEADDVDKLAGLIHVPCLLVSGGALAAVAERDDLRKRLGRWSERHREIGVSDAQFEVRDHRRLAARFVSVDVQWTFYNSDAAPIAEFGVNYTLTAPETGWKIACMLPLDISPARSQTPATPPDGSG